MIRFEVYGEEALDDLCSFVSKFNINTCSGDCTECVKKAKKWLLTEYQGKTNWSKVPSDGQIRKNKIDKKKKKRRY